ncbi:hypothetical protein B566_EDAN005609 [Ephemera danica]|nr:hypothetical protein B566_EDAN005609 [Ephemera danica]
MRNAFFLFLFQKIARLIYKSFIMALGTSLENSHSATDHPSKPSEVTAAVSILESNTLSIPENTRPCLRCKVKEIAVINLACGHATTCDGCAYFERKCSECHKPNKADLPLH